MATAIAHRGPDSSGVWSDAEAGIVLAHCRLAIIDLSPAGHQPMASASGRFVIAFNGEIYNHLDLRRALDADGLAPNWRGTSDTETLLAYIDARGIETALSASAGMFAFAVWDRETRSLTLARDRLGEKPLYYGRAGQTFVFGSDLAALRRHPEWIGEIDRDALALLMRHNYIPAPYSIYRGISKLKPGTLLTFNPATRESRERIYWSAAEAQRRANATPFSGSADDAVDLTEKLLGMSLAGQMVADVPLGAFLSGGIDSSVVVAAMQELSPRPIKTFTIGFEQADYDEARHAAAIARHLGTDHTELTVTERDTLDVVPDLARIYSEPFSDSSQIPTYLVSRLARQSVTVALSGDGGDELFSGYTRYALGGRIATAMSRVPRPLRRAAASAVHAVSPSAWDRVARMSGRVLPEKLRTRRAGDSLHKAASIFAARDSDEAYQILISHWAEPDQLVLGAGASATAGAATVDAADAVRRMMLADLTGYLPGDILTKVDRASMAVSLEVRVPFLDHRLVEFVLSLPLTILRRNGEAKWPLRALLERRVPRHLFERPKMGFGVPLDSWLRGPLKDWAESLLDRNRLMREGYFEPEVVRQAWADHLAGRVNLSYRLWDVLMFQAWLEAEAAGHRVSQPVA